MSDNEIKKALKQIQDYLCPRLDAYEQMLYYYLFRHSHLEGSPECIVGIKSLRLRVGMGTGMPGRPPSEEQIRVKIRSLEKKGAINLLERSREGTRIRVVLPHDIPDCVPLDEPKHEVDIDTVDFSKSPYRELIISRENNKCFYCFKELKKGRCELDHVLASANGGDNSYRNLVASCLDCNNGKGDQDVEAFLRSLYRNNLISNEEMQDRLKAVSELKEGKRIPPISDMSG